jgi:hypothetical protein
MPKWLTATNALHAFHAAIIVGGSIGMYYAHILTADQLRNILVPYGAFWSGVGGVVTLGGSKVAATTPPVTAPVTAAPLTPVPPVAEPIVGVPDTMVAHAVAPLAAPVMPTALGAEHGAPTA